MKKCRQNRRKWIILLTLICVLLMAGSAAAASISTKTATLAVGGTQKLTIRGISASKKVTWKSAKSSVASVTSKGVVKGVRAGKTKITAKVGKSTFTCTVTVKNVKLSATKATIQTNGIYRLALKGSAASDKITWSSGNKKVATVTAAGVVRGIKTGQTKITAKFGNKTFACTMTVSEPMQMNVSALTMRVGASYTLQVKGTTAKPVWITGNSAVASVSDKGVVTGKKAGSTKITAKVSNKLFFCLVTVKETATKTTTVTVQVPVPAAPVSGTATAAPQSYVVTGKSTAVAMSANERTVYNTIMSFKTKYPEGRTFTNADYYEWTGGIYRGGYGCAGFCFELSDAAFPGTLAKLRTTNLTTGLRVGDIIRLDYNTHSVIITQVFSDYVIVAEANYNKSVHWGRKITFKEIEKTGTNIMTRYTNSTSAQFAAMMKIRASLPDLSDPRQ